MKTEYHILNLGAGVQSTTLYLMFMRGEIKPQIDCAIFADTQEEPQAVYEHLAWLQSLGGPEILVRTAGKLGDDLCNGRYPSGAEGTVRRNGYRFASIPCFTEAEREVVEYEWSDEAQDEIEVPTGEFTKEVGRTRRQCSKEYKTEVIERTIRREVLGMEQKQRIPRSVHVHQYLGISLDEAGRARRIAERFAQTARWATPHFPLVERFWTRPDCLTYLAEQVPHQTPRSACVFCPYHDDREWFHIRETDPEAWRRAVEIDRALRVPGNIVNRKMDAPMYLHRSCVPLDQVVFDTRPRARDLQLSMSFASVCEGVCGV